ncbi:MAG TPA: transcriptional regulator [Lactobacillus sp.]|nr:transcriptional regulator [Lactobacillus sp.]
MDAVEMSERHGELCPLDATLKVLDGKWKSIILCRLMDHEYRYSELLKTLPGCTRRMLSLQLQQLMHDQIIVKRIDTHYIPTATSYRLTVLGRTLVPVVLAMNNWGKDYLRALA